MEKYFQRNHILKIFYVTKIIIRSVRKELCWREDPEPEAKTGADNDESQDRKSEGEMVELTQEEDTCEIWSIGVCVTDKVGYRPADIFLDVTSVLHVSQEVQDVLQHEEIHHLRGIKKTGI